MTNSGHNDITSAAELSRANLGTETHSNIPFLNGSIVIGAASSAFLPQ